MSEEQENEERSQPDTGLPREQERRQEDGSSITLSLTFRADGERRRQPPLPLLPRSRRPTMPAAAPQHAAGSHNGPKLPPLRAAASSPSARGRALATGLRGSRLPELAPSPQCPLRVRDGAARAEQQRGSAAQGISAVLVPMRSRPKEGHELFLGRAAAGSPKVGVQPAVPKCHAPARSIRHGTLPELVPRPQLSLSTLSWANTLSPAKSVSLPRRLMSQGPNAADTTRGTLGERSATSRAEGQVPAPADSQTRDVGEQVELQEREETVEWETTECSSGKLWSASLGPSEEADTARSASLPDAGPRPAEPPEPLPPASVLEGAESSDSSKAVPSVEEPSGAPVLPSACKEGEREEPANATPESSTRALGETPRLQDPGEMSWEAFAYSEIQAKIRRICEAARKEMMLSSGNTSGPCSVGVPRLLMLQAADDSASTADASQGMLGNCATGPKAEGPLPVSDDSQTTDVQAVQQISEEITEVESGDLQSPSEEAEADTACSASLPDAGPMPAGHPEPLPPASVLEGAESSDSSKAVPSVEEPSGAPVLPSVCKEGEREEPANATPESSTRALGETPRLQDPGEMSWEAFAYSEIQAKIRRICEAARKEMMLSSGNTSGPCSVGVPRLLTLQAADDSASAADASQGMQGKCASGPKAEGPLPVSDGSQTTDVQAVQQTSEEITEAESGDQQSPSEEAEAETECSASLPDAGPMPAEYPEPLPPASVLEDAESSGSSKPASSPQEASSASLSSESEGGEREEGAMAMPESSGQALGEAQRLQDPRETARDTYGNPPIHPAIRRIREEDRRERMLPSWNTSRRRDVRNPTLQRFLSSGDAFSTAGTVQGNLGTRPSRTEVRIRHTRVDQRWSPRLSAVLAEISDGNDGAAGTARDMQDAKDTAVTDEGVQDLRDSAVTEDADSQHEVSAEAGGGARSSECFRDVPEDGPGTAAAPHRMQQLATGCQLSSGGRFGLYAEPSPAAA
ncbi:hypothetical protein ASZ78_010186 [Callipepla squamata]|uniref:Uncharacterized protein n=1 Tax=Callipepla squamata TaxID=9009 RepID=A0A226MCS7_CALSU|nr:hypothetical protein ASZ78_010186 [Callipepla squamata]